MNFGELYSEISVPNPNALESNIKIESKSYFKMDEIILDWKLFHHFDGIKDMSSSKSQYYFIARAYLNKDTVDQNEVLVEICPLIVSSINDSEDIQI